MKDKYLIKFRAPLNEGDTETQTYGCRQNNPDICGHNMLEGICHFVVMTISVRDHQEFGKINITSSRVKCENWRLLKRKTALKVLSFGAVFAFEPPLEESRSKIYLVS